MQVQVSALEIRFIVNIRMKYYKRNTNHIANFDFLTLVFSAGTKNPSHISENNLSTSDHLNVVVNILLFRILQFNILSLNFNMAELT